MQLTMPKRKKGHRILCIGEYCYWQPKDIPLKGNDLVPFYDGDYTDVLDMDDPRIQAEFLKQKYGLLRPDVQPQKEYALQW